MEGKLIITCCKQRKLFSWTSKLITRFPIYFDSKPFWVLVNFHDEIITNVFKMTLIILALTTRPIRAIEWTSIFNFPASCQFIVCQYFKAVKSTSAAEIYDDRQIIEEFRYIKFLDLFKLTWLSVVCQERERNLKYSNTRRLRLGNFTISPHTSTSSFPSAVFVVICDLKISDISYEKKSKNAKFIENKNGKHLFFWLIKQAHTTQPTIFFFFLPTNTFLFLI